MSEPLLSAPCPNCHTEMIYITHLPHRLAPQMQQTTFVCYTCNQTRSYALSMEMAVAYAGIAAPVQDLLDGVSEPHAAASPSSA